MTDDLPRFILLALIWLRRQKPRAVVSLDVFRPDGVRAVRITGLLGKLTPE